MKHNVYISKAIRFISILTIFATFFALTSCMYMIPLDKMENIFQQDNITEGFDNVVDYTVTEKDLQTGSLVLADNHRYNYEFTADELELIGTYRNNNLVTDESGKAIGKYYMNSQSQMKLTKEAVVAAHNMLVDAEKAVQKDDILINYTYGYNEGDNEEYKTALVIYLTNYDGAKLDSDYGRWLDENAVKYGFIESFEDGFRYVGMPHAKAISESNNITSLVDYVEYLKTNTDINKTVEIVIDGATYMIYYVACTEGDTIKIPADYEYTISGTNEGGVIVTVKTH